jgi:hypothetical protein
MPINYQKSPSLLILVHKIIENTRFPLIMKLISQKI